MPKKKPARRAPREAETELFAQVYSTSRKKLSTSAKVARESLWYIRVWRHAFGGGAPRKLFDKKVRIVGGKTRAFEYVDKVIARVRRPHDKRTLRNFYESYYTPSQGASAWSVTYAEKWYGPIVNQSGTPPTGCNDSRSNCGPQ
jgi:hypothetical protein